MAINSLQNVSRGRARIPGMITGYSQSQRSNQMNDRAREAALNRQRHGFSLNAQEQELVKTPESRALAERVRALKMNANLEASYRNYRQSLGLDGGSGGHPTRNPDGSWTDSDGNTYKRLGGSGGGNVSPSAPAPSPAPTTTLAKPKPLMPPSQAATPPVYLPPPSLKTAAAPTPVQRIDARLQRSRELLGKQKMSGTFSANNQSLYNFKDRVWSGIAGKVQSPPASITAPPKPAAPVATPTPKPKVSQARFTANDGKTQLTMEEYRDDAKRNAGATNIAPPRAEVIAPPVKYDPVAIKRQQISDRVDAQMKVQKAADIKSGVWGTEGYANVVADRLKRRMGRRAA